MAKQCVNSCCFCFTLETGVLILAWLSIIGGVILTLYYGFILGITSIALSQANLTSDESTILTYAVVFATVYIIFGIFSIIAGILTIIGVKNQQYKKLIFYLILMGFEIVLYLFGIENSAGGFINACIAIAIGVYYFICVYSLYSKIKNESNTHV